MKYQTLLIFFVFTVSSLFNNNICASQLSTLVARYNRLINAQVQTPKITQRLTRLRKELKPFIEEVLAWLEEKAATDSDNEETDNSDNDCSDSDCNDLTGSDEDFYATLIQFVDDPNYFSPEEQSDILKCLTTTHRHKCRCCDYP